MRTTEQIIEDAKNNIEIKDYNLLELHLFLVIQQILKMYSNNQLSKEQANKYRVLAIKDYNNKIKEYEVENEMFKKYIEDIKKTENLRIELRKQLNKDTELNEVINTCIELIQLYSGEEFI